MSDLREQLRKAGLVSEKQIRQAKHQDRLHAAEVGREGILAEKRAEAERQRQEEEARRRRDRERAEASRRQNEENAARERVATLIRGGRVREATFGARRFFFQLPSGRITFLDLTDEAARSVSTGSAAIVSTLGLAREEFCVMRDPAASELQRVRPDAICLWNRGHGESGPGERGGIDPES